MKLCKNSVTICLFVLALLGCMETHGSLGANQPGSNRSNVTVAAAPSPSSTADGSSPQDYLNVHNAARAAVGVRPLTWDDVVARYAADHAKQRISQCELVESRGPYGENLAWSKNDLSGSDAVKMWIDEKHYYDFESNSCSPGYDCAYYTQVIWKYSIRLGCAKVRCNNGGTFIVCNYDPPAKHPENLSLIGAISPNPAAEPDSFDPNDLMGLVVGLIVGACALIVVLCLGCCFCSRRKRNKDNANGDHDNHVIIGAISPSAAPAPHSFPSEHPKRRKNIRGLVVGLIVGASGLILGLGLLVVGLIVGACALIFGLGVFLGFFLRRLRREDDTNVDDHDHVSDMFFHNSDFRHGAAPRKFSLEELAKVTNMFKGEKLGEGGFGAVYRGYLRDLDTHVAVKRISKASKQGIKEYASEVKIISRLRHKNLVKLIGWCHEKRELLLVYEFMANGSLDSHLFKGKSLLNWEVRCKIVQDLASALLYLHEEGDHCVLHRDIKASTNSMVLIGNSKLSSLKALITVLTVYEDSLLEKMTEVGGKIPDQLIFSCMEHICRSFLDTLEPLSRVPDVSEDVLDFLTSQADLLLHLTRSVRKSLSMSVCLLLLKTSGTGLKMLNDLRTIVTGVNNTMKLLIMLILLSMEFCWLDSHISGVKDKESIEGFAEISNVSLGLLPILCNCVTVAECHSLCLTALDLTLKGFLTPDTWFPIIHKHLQLQHVVLKLQDKNSFGSVPVLLKFFLTIARVRGGAEMLLNAGFFSSLKLLFADMSDGRVSSVINSGKKLSTLSDKIEKPQLIWGLGLAVITAMVHSLGDSSLSIDIVANVIPYLFSEKAHLISYFLSAPDFPSDDHDKKRPRAQRTWTSLSKLMETEQTLMLMCVLAQHWNTWVKAMKDTDSQLREMSIHLLAFISCGNQRLGEAPSRIPPLICPPILKDELDCCNKPSFVNSKNGWFALSPLGCISKPKFSGISTTALVIKDQATESNNYVSQTYFSDSVAIQIYRIAFLLLKFLCLQAEGAAKGAEELGYVDLAHFPELPMPEILHGIQDQAIAIVTELCETNRSKQIQSEVQQVCLLLLQTIEMALYLELCVLQICGIKPMLGRVEDVSKEVKLLMKATEGHAFLKGSMKSLSQIISLVYPGLP